MRDPLLHFILLGIAIFGLHWLWGTDTDTVQITASMVAAAEADFSRRVGRDPELHERAQILELLIEEEILYREGQSLSLEEGDPVLRRRLITRMRLLMASTAPPHPTDEDLTALLAAHPERYIRPPHLTLTHVFFNAARHHHSLPDALRRAEAMLLAGAEPSVVGDPFLHGRRMMDADEAELSERFGSDFAAEVFTLSAGEWWPVRSRYGEHLVWIEVKQPSRPATLAQARGALTADWQQSAREVAEAEAFAAIRERYRVETP